MFRSDKDLKLGSRRRGQGSGSGSARGGDGRDEVVEKARRERAEREKLRASRGHVLLIQRWYRGRSVAAKARAKERTNWDRKMSDFGKLQRTLVSRGIPFVPPIAFVLQALQQLLFFYRSNQDSDRLCLFCDVVLTLCVAHPEPGLNAGAHLVGAGGGIVDGKVVPSREGLAASLPALRLRLRRLLAVCTHHVEKELNKGVADGNTPLKVLLLLAGGSNGLTARPSDDPAADTPPAAVEILSLVSRSCLEILVFELNLFSVTRNVLLGNKAERSAVATAGGSTPMKPPPERQRAIQGSWELALAALDAVGTLSPTGAKVVGTSIRPRDRPPPPPDATGAAFAAATSLRAAFVTQLMSVPLLPSRLGADGVNLLLRERAGAFVDCLEDFLVEMKAANLTAMKGPAVGNSAASGSWRSSWDGAFELPPSPVSCCSTETFLLGNVVAFGTKLPVDDGRGRGGGEAASGIARGLREFMRTVTGLLELQAIPESLLTDRQAITWQSQGGGGRAGGGGTSMTALAVPQAVQDQVRLLVSDRWIRAATRRALEGVNEGLLKRCSEEERRENLETLELSAANLAIASVQSYRQEAGRGIVSKWAEKLLSHGKRLFSAATEQAVGASPATPATLAALGSARSGLVDSTAASRAAAMGRAPSAHEKEGAETATKDPVQGAADPAEKPHAYDKASVLALSELLGVLLRRWGSGANASNQVMQGVMSTLCFSFPCVARLWAFTINECQGSFERLCNSAPIDSLTGGGLHATVAVMCCLFAHLLVVLDDADLYDNGRPLPLHHVRAVVKGLKRPLFTFCWEEQEKKELSRTSSDHHFGAFYAGAAERLLRGLYARSSRRALCRSEAWVVPEAESNRVLAEIKTLSTRSRRLLRAMPFCMSLTRRVRVFEHLVKTDKALHQPENTPGVPLRVRRGHVLEDGLAALGSGGKAERQMKRRLTVMYTSAAGHEESGIDMGGLFKDFWTDLSALAFDVNYGMFRVTKEGLMYPNPSSGMVHGSEHLRLFEFLGRILGKALYEGITVQPEFATFFLGFIRGDYNFLHLFHDLNGLDPELYRNLMFLKTYSGGDVEDLCLTFAVADDAFGANREVELVPGGSRRAVTSANRLEYVNRVAKHHLVDGVKPQAEAFVRGLWEVIDPQWLQMFSEPELQVLISGSNKTMDVEDLRRHTRYSGGFVGVDRTVRRFWSVLNSMDARERAALLRFVTSCERPPPLGFESMQPPFCLHRVGVRSDEERLPTASTCFNTLKLPTYSSERVMKAKLLTSIFSGTGFELS